MRKAVSALILAAATVAAMPAFAQANPQDPRDGRRDAPREYRQDGRRDDPRQDARQNDRRAPVWNNNGRPGGAAPLPAPAPGLNANRPGGGPGGAWNNSWRNDRRYDWQGYRQANRRFYTLPRYYGPDRSPYRRFGVGGRLGAPFFAQRYWIADPWAYRLPPVYGPYRWVRYYNDVLLVDIYTGLVRDALYGFFY